MSFLKRHLGTMLVGALVVGGVSYVGAQAMTAPDQVSLAQAEESPSPDGGRPGGMRGPKGGMRGALRGELVVPGEEDGTFRTVRFDRGVLERVEGSTVVIKEADGTVVEVPTAESTRIVRDGESAELSALKAGDHVFTNRVDEGDGLITKHVRAFSPERWAEMEKRREECRENRQQCRAERMQRRGERRDEQPAT